MGEKVTELQSYDETWDKPMRSYWAIDPQGKKIEVNTKNIAKHESDNIIEQHPTFFLNLGSIISHPDKVQSDTSNTPKAHESNLAGKTQIYVKEDYLDSLGIPGYINIRNEQTKIVVFYGNDGENFTRTYRTEVK